MQPFRFKSSFLRPSCQRNGPLWSPGVQGCHGSLTFRRRAASLSAALSFLCRRVRDGVCLPQGCSVPREPSHCSSRSFSGQDFSLPQGGDCYHLSRDCKSIRHTTPLTRRICNICARVAIQASGLCKEGIGDPSAQRGCKHFSFRGEWWASGQFSRRHRCYQTSLTTLGAQLALFETLW